MRKLLVSMLALVLSLVLVGTSLAQDDKPSKPHLGIRVTATDEGVVVKRVVEGSPAAEAGVLVDDVLVSVDDQAIESAADLSTIIAEHTAGDVISLTLLRDGTETTLEITLVERVSKGNTTADTELDPVAAAQKTLHVELSASDTGYEVTELSGHSAEDETLAVGDVITAVNETPIAEVDWQTLRSNNTVLALTVLRDNEEITVEIEQVGKSPRPGGDSDHSPSDRKHHDLHGGSSDTI
ncbi:MAG TPA: PDZ domain-containing protein [Aggregatilineaceae bacterium]|nr:PDZ domain-containing protein [Aggregatilineaceae bacterium]